MHAIRIFCDVCIFPKQYSISKSMLLDTAKQSVSPALRVKNVSTIFSFQGKSPTNLFPYTCLSYTSKYESSYEIEIHYIHIYILGLPWLVEFTEMTRILMCLGEILTYRLFDINYLYWNRQGNLLEISLNI